MNIWQRIKKYFYGRRKKKLGLTFPLFCKVHGVKQADRQGALAQSRAGDLLQIVHVPTESYPCNVYVYSVAINRVLGYLHEGLSEKFVTLFGKNFCRDAVIENITGGAPEYKYFGCNIRILETCGYMKGCKDFSLLREN